MLNANCLFFDYHRFRRIAYYTVGQIIKIIHYFHCNIGILYCINAYFWAYTAATTKNNNGSWQQYWSSWRRNRRISCITCKQNIFKKYSCRLYQNRSYKILNCSNDKKKHTITRLDDVYCLTNSLWKCHPTKLINYLCICYVIIRFNQIHRPRHLD